MVQKQPDYFSKKRIFYALRNGIGVGLFLFIILGLLKLGNADFYTVYTSPQALRQLGYYLIGACLGYYFFGWWANQGKQKDHEA